MTLLRSIRNALGSTYLGDTKLAKALGFSSVQTFDSRLIAFLQGLGQAVDAPLADAVSGLNIHDTLYGLGFTQTERNARLQAFYNDLRHSIESRQKIIDYKLTLNRIDPGPTTYLSGPSGPIDLSALSLNSYFDLTAATANHTAPSEVILADAGFTFSSPLYVKHEVGVAKINAAQATIGLEQKLYADSVPVPNEIQSTDYPDNGTNPFLLYWGRSLSRVHITGAGTTPVCIVLELPRPRNRNASSVLPSLLCLDELVLRLTFGTTVIPDSGIDLLVTTGNVESCAYFGDISVYSALSSGSALVIRARTPAVADDYVNPPGSLPAWRLDMWGE